jgi:hypothetical protein
MLFIETLKMGDAAAAVVVFAKENKGQYWLFTERSKYFQLTLQKPRSSTLDSQTEKMTSRLASSTRTFLDSRWLPNLSLGLASITPFRSKEERKDCSTIFMVTSSQDL